MSGSTSKKTGSRRRDWIVGVGASAGGLEALTQFVSHLPADFPAPIVVAQHLAPHSKSMMVELLARHTPLEVTAAEDRTQLKAGVIYVIPPNHDADLIDDYLALSVADERTRPKPSIDVLFDSFARGRGSKAVGIVLSGTGSDGSRGIQAIKAAGGVTLAQDDHSAKYDGMPRSAVGTGDIDTILPPDVIARNLVALLRDQDARVQVRGIDRPNLERLFDIIRTRLGQDFSAYKSATIERRVIKRISSVGASSLEEYVRLIERKPSEAAALAQELLISVTSFFRDGDAFEALQEQIDRRVEAKESGEEFRAWVAGCATGEEAYTAAMLLMEAVEKKRRPLHLKVFATDLDQDAILEARAGVYSHDDVQRVAPELRERYFHRLDANRWEASKRLKEAVVFARQDLIQNPPFVKLDLVTCRNVLIYFEPALQKRIFEIFHYSLLPSGLLMLGKSESPLSAPGLFETLDKKARVYEKLSVASTVVPGGRMRALPIEAATVPKRRTDTPPSIAELAYKRILEIHGLAAAIVDADANLVQIVGDVSPYMSFHNSLADLRLTNLLPKSAAIEVPALVRRALTNPGPHRSRSHKLPHGAKNETFSVIASALDGLRENSVSRRLVVVSFETKRSSRAILAAADSGAGLDSDARARVLEIEQELHVTREHLQTVIEELGVSNEELQSLNEELTSTNEEMQATNEELETTNEELQSTNEELTTVNEELSARTSELKAANVNLENIQNSIGSPLVVLDASMRVVRFNPDALKIFRLDSSDVGRDISSVSAVCEIPDFRDVLKSTIATGTASERICENAHSVFQMRALPCFDENRKVAGAILIFIDNTQLIRARERLEASERRIRAIIDGTPSQIALKDAFGRYLVANAAFCEFFNLRHEDVIGRTDREIFPEETANMFREADLEVLVRRAPVRRTETVEASGERRVFNASRFPLADGDESHPTAIGTISVDVTAAVNAQEALQRSENRYRAIVEDQAVFVCRFSPEGALTFVNPLFTSYFGGAADARAGQKIFDVLDPADKGAFQSALGGITSRHPAEQLETRVARFGSQPRWVRWILRGTFDPQGELVEHQAVGFDVTDYRAQTDELLQKEAIFGGIFNNTADFIAIYRVDGARVSLESLNRSAERSMGFAYGQLVGRDLDEMLAPEEREIALARYRRAIETGKPEVFDESIRFPGSVRHFLTTLVPIASRDGSIDRIAALSRDVSTYKQIELDLRAAKDAAEIANRAKSDFLASMSHELRTPLNVVLGLSQILEQSPLGVDQRDHVVGIQRSGRALLSLIEDILDISKIEAGKIRLNPAPFAVKDLAIEVVSLFRLPAEQKGVQLLLEIDDGADQTVVGDIARVRQIAVNLMSNALKFTDEGSVKLKIGVDGRFDDGDLMLRFAVTDTGIGIRDEDKAKIFQKFSQVDSGHSRRYGGTGLGLVISKHFAELMRGEVGFESEWGEGSAFWFTIKVPVSQRGEEFRRKRAAGAELAAAASVRALRPAGGDRALRVLAVDDNRDSQNVVALFLKRLGHKPVLASNGPEAVDAVANNKDLDVVLMDVQMPGMDGYETTRKIRATLPGADRLPIIALTANAMAGDAERCLESGMDDYLSKPLNMDDLATILEKWALPDARQREI